MTLYIPNGATNKSITFNTPNLIGSHTLKLISLYNKNEINWDLTLSQSNDRYSEFDMSISADDRLGHLNGIYTYHLLDGETLIEYGLMKYISAQGGSNGTQPFISNKEELFADTYFRPTY